MCGIAGQVRLKEGPRADPGAVGLMTAAIIHRGPDDSGLYSDPEFGCALGHRRLSVIDLACGHQPLGNEDGSVQTVFNGEIYNFLELRAELEAKGHRFRTHTDTEVLVHLWEELGPAMADRLRGMFALAIWDRNTRTFFAARDPLGKKPFYYSTLGNIFRFGSELKSLMADPALHGEVNPQSVLFYLHMGYVPDPWTILRGVKKLPPGHGLLVRDGEVKVERYWRVPRKPTFRGSYEDAKRELRRLVTQAVRRRLIADVPLGAFLSGGIDSTIVVGLMAEMRNAECSEWNAGPTSLRNRQSQNRQSGLQTFTIGFDEAQYDESAYARLVANRFGTEHHEKIVRPNALDVLPLLARHFDEPFADSSAIPTYYVSKFAREHVTVALTGDGGDETFGGYRRYRAGKIAKLIADFPAGPTMIAWLSRRIPASVDRTSNLGRAKRIFEQLGASPASAYLAQMTHFAQSDLDRLLTPEFSNQIDPDATHRWFNSLYEATDPDDPSAASMSADIESYLPFDILTKVDRASMAVSLECRSPLLDRDVVEFAASLPTDWRLKGFSGHKHILKDTFADLLPPEILRRRKSGFAIPLPQWFRGPLRPMLHDVLLSSKAKGRGYVRPTEVERLIAEHQAGQNHAASLWSLLMLELWFAEWGVQK